MKSVNNIFLPSLQPFLYIFDSCILGENPLHLAIVNGDLKAVTYFVNQGADVNSYCKTEIDLNYEKSKNKESFLADPAKKYNSELLVCSASSVYGRYSDELSNHIILGQTGKALCSI